jgi:riboflavin kinase / FMN adenylyltransferase
MQVHRGVEHLPKFSNAVITIGTFDGVHEGHRKIISTLVDEASACKGESLIISFDPHPRKIIRPNEPLQLLNSLDEKIELLSKTGLDHLVVVPFTEEFSELSAEAYIEDFLVRNFRPHTIIIGYDHHFGKGRQGNFSLLEAQSKSLGYRLLEIPQHRLDEIAISSTNIRKAILSGAVEEANKLLGYGFFFSGRVIHGDKLGRTLGYPTANLEYTDEEKIRLAHGVYAVQVSVQGALKKGMLSIGNRPTLTGSDERVEVNIFDFDQDIYGERITVIVKKFLRLQEKYDSLEELKLQLARDEEKSRKLL